VDLFYKDPDAKLDYGFDWATWLGSDTISSSSWTVPTGLTKVSDTNDTTTTTVWLSGGTAGVSYRVVNSIVTAGGREEDRSLWIVMKER
jgi:hypothetical protein